METPLAGHYINRHLAVGKTQLHSDCISRQGETRMEGLLATILALLLGLSQALAQTVTSHRATPPPHAFIST